MPHCASKLGRLGNSLVISIVNSYLRIDSADFTRIGIVLIAGQLLVEAPCSSLQRSSLLALRIMVWSSPGSELPSRDDIRSTKSIHFTNIAVRGSRCDDMRRLRGRHTPLDWISLVEER